MATNQKERYTFQDAAKRRKVRDSICDVIVAGSSADFQEYVLPIWNGLEQEFQQDIPSPTSNTSFSILTKMVEEHQQIWWTRASDTQQEKLAIEQTNKLAIEQTRAANIQQANAQQQENLAIEQEQARQQAEKLAIEQARQYKQTVQQQELLNEQRLKQRAEKAKQRFLAEINQMQAAFRFQHPYECKRCPERFSSNTKLHRHIDASHAKKPTETSQSTASTASIAVSPSSGISTSSPPAETPISSSPASSAPTPSSGISISSPSSSPVPSTETPPLFAETQASFQTLYAFPPSQTLPAKISARLLHESHSNWSLSPVTPRQTIPAALCLTPPSSPGCTYRELGCSTPRQTITPASLRKNVIKKAKAATASSPASRPLSPVFGSKQHENVIEKAQTVIPFPPTSRSLSPASGTKRYESTAITTALGSVTSPPPTPRPSSPASGTRKHETSPLNAPAAPYVPPHKRQNSYTTIGDLFAKFSASPRLSAIPGIIRSPYMTMHDLFVKFCGSNSHGSNSHGSNSHGSNSHDSNSHGSMFKRKSANQEQALMSAPNGLTPAFMTLNYVDQSGASLAVKSAKSDSACSRNSASIATSPYLFRPPPAYTLASHSYRQSSSPSASSLALPQAPLMSSPPYVHKMNWREDNTWRSQNSITSLERLLKSLLHTVRDTGHALHTIQLR